MDDLSLIYYGHVFDATGYGQAARGYCTRCTRPA